MPHSLRYFPVALACSLTLNAHLTSESQSAPRHQVPLSPTATLQPGSTRCEPMPFCLLSEPQSQPVSTTSRIIKSPRKPAPGFLLKSKLKHLKTIRRTIRHDPLNANLTPSHSVILQLSINPAKRSSKGAYAGAANSAQSFPHPKKDRAEATTDGVIRLPRRSISTAAVWGLTGYNYQWNTLATGTAPHTSYADRASPYGTLTPLNDVADASFPTRLGIPLGRIMDFGTVTPAPGSFSMPPVLAPAH
jgi:hypothetical protein